MYQLEFAAAHSYGSEREGISVPVLLKSGTNNVRLAASIDTTFSTVYFFADASMNKNVLRRVGWLDRFRVGLVDHDRALYLAGHDDDAE